MSVVRQHDLVDRLKRPLTAAERGRIVDRTGQVWKERTVGSCDLVAGRAFLVVGPPVLYSAKSTRGQAYANHPVVDFLDTAERFYRSENLDEVNKDTWNVHYERVL